MEAWLRRLPVMLLLDDGTLVQHTDDDDYSALGQSVEELYRNQLEGRSGDEIAVAQQPKARHKAAQKTAGRAVHKRRR